MAECYNGLTFAFNGKSSDLYNLYMGWRSAEEEWSAGLDREIVKGEMNVVRHVPNLYGVKYADVLTLEFDIFHQDGSAFDQRESRNINNWLMQDTYKRFKVNDNNTENVYYKAICTSIQDLTIGRWNGKHVTMTCDSPFAYTGEVKRKMNALESGELLFSLSNNSDDGIYYPCFTIVCDSEYDGDVEIMNITEGKTMLFKMADIPATEEGKVLNVDSLHTMITDADEKLVPLYKIGWQMDVDENDALQSTEMYWLRLVEGINKFSIIGNAKVIFTISFPRKVGQINEE